MPRPPSIPLLAPLAALGLCLALAAAGPRWPVRAQVTVDSNVVRVGDLFAPGAAASAPAEVRQRVLSAAPQPGVPLRWSAPQLAGRLRQAGLLADQFTLPEEIVVRRAAQPIPAAVVLEALSALLHHPVDPAAVRFTAPLTTAGDPAVRIVQIRPDAAHGSLEVVCRARHDAALLPFLVSVALPPAEIAAQLRAHAPTPALGVLAQPERRPVLVRPGRTAELHISNRGFTLTTRVEPLQQGRLGDQIQVRNLATKALLHVVVTGPGEVGTPEQENPHER